MKTRVAIIAAFLLALVLGLVGYSYQISQPLFDEMRESYDPKIAARSEALTFARTATKLILVTAHGEHTVSGIDLAPVYGIGSTTDLIEWLSQVDPGELRSLALAEITVPLDDLVSPVNYRFPYIAVGTNFKAHAEEVYLDDPPFLFPKLARAGQWRDQVSFIPRLDYEAELCVFPLADIEAVGTLPRFGLVLCNDFTDRWTLVKELDLSSPMGTTGFASAKGCETCLPTGYLVVIPTDPEFYKSIKLRLFVNNVLRQKFSMEEVILPVEEIVRQAFELKDAPFSSSDTTVTLLQGNRVPAGTLILTGTAAGVIFKPANIWYQGFYLQPGDVVRTEALYLGHLLNRVSE